MTEKFLHKPASLPIRTPAVDDGISGKPFHSVEDAKAEAIMETTATPIDSSFPPVGRDSKDSDKTRGDQTPIKPGPDGKEMTEVRAVEVPVGVSRLHMTSLPALQMKPLYWSPINDIAIVTRATWFYR